MYHILQRVMNSRRYYSGFVKTFNKRKLSVVSVLGRVMNDKVFVLMKTFAGVL